MTSSRTGSLAENAVPAAHPLQKRQKGYLHEPVAIAAALLVGHLGNAYPENFGKNLLKAYEKHVAACPAQLRLVHPWHPLFLLAGFCQRGSIVG